MANARKDGGIEALLARWLPAGHAPTPEEIANVSSAPRSTEEARSRHVQRFVVLAGSLHARSVGLRRHYGDLFRLGKDPSRQALAPIERSLRDTLSWASLDAELFERYCPPMRARVEDIKARVDKALSAGVMDRLVRRESFRQESFEIERVTGVLITALGRTDGPRTAAEVSHPTILALHDLSPQAHRNLPVHAILTAFEPLPLLAPGRHEDAIAVIRDSLRATRRDWRFFERDNLEHAIIENFPTDPALAGLRPVDVVQRRPEPTLAKRIGGRIEGLVREGMERSGVVISVGPSTPYAAAMAGGGRLRSSRDNQFER